MSVYLLNEMFIYFSPVWKYCTISQQRINSIAFVQNMLLLVFGERANGGGRKQCMWDFSLFCFFILLGWFRVIGIRGEELGVWKTKADSHLWQKKKKRGGRRGETEFLFLCLGENLRSLFFLSCVSSHLPLHLSSPSLLCFLITQSHTLPPTPSPKNPCDL